MITVGLCALEYTEACKHLQKLANHDCHGHGITRQGLDVPSPAGFEEYAWSRTMQNDKVFWRIPRDLDMGSYFRKPADDDVRIFTNQSV